MSWRDNLSTAQARLTALEAAETKLLCGEAVAAIQYEGERLEYARGASLREVQAAITETRAIIARLGGGRRGGAIIPMLRG